MLRESGLLDITIKTANLLKDNTLLQREINELKSEMDQLIKSLPLKQELETERLDSSNSDNENLRVTSTEEHPRKMKKNHMHHYSMFAGQLDLKDARSEVSFDSGMGESIVSHESSDV